MDRAGNGHKAAAYTSRQFVAPSPDLRAYVRRYCIATVDARNPVNVPAYANSMLVIMLGEALLGSIEEQRWLPGAALFCGPQTQPTLMRAPVATMRFLAVEFNAGGLLAVTGESACSLTGTMADLGNFLTGPGFRDLAANLSAIGHVPDMIVELESCLRHQLIRREPLEVRHARHFAALLERTPHGRIAQHAAAMGMSSAMLRRCVHRAVGLSPKAYADGLRMMAGLRVLLDRPRTDLTALAHHLDFFDASHFHRRFSRFAGVAPAKVDADGFAIANALM